MQNTREKKDKKVEDIIEGRIENGQYDLFENETKIKNGQNIPCRYAFSAPIALQTEDKVTNLDGFTNWNSEGDINENRDGVISNIGPTDSEVTVVRVKMDNSFLKAPENNWNLKDEAIPGDGTHLGDSPSLVNLATLVVRTKICSKEADCEQDRREYLIPLSSWDPSDKPNGINDADLRSDSVGTENISNSDSNMQNKSDKSNISPRPSFAGRITKFLRKHMIKKRHCAPNSKSETLSISRRDNNSNTSCLTDNGQNEN